MNAIKSRKLAAVMFTDIVGYTAIMQRDEKQAGLIRMRHRSVFEKTHENYNGNILQYFGDGTLSIFQSGVEAVECAIAIQREVLKEQSIPLRIGIHIGDLVFDGVEVYGDSVNVASRIENLGVAGSILISDQLQKELKNHRHILTQSLGLTDLKNIEQPVEIYAISNEGITVPQMLLKTQKQNSKSIAVLPLVNMSSDPEFEYFCDGMTEEIINALAKIKGLKVTSRTSSFFFKNKNLPIGEIGDKLNVSTIIEGSVRVARDKLRITIQLIEVNNDFHFWSETFDRSLQDIFAVQDEVSLIIAEKLREHIGHFDIEDRLTDSMDIPVETYLSYLKARFHLLKMRKSDLDTGMEILKDIIERHPDFPQGHLGMHMAYSLLGTLGMMPATKAFEEGNTYLKKAISINNKLPECQIQLSWVEFLQNWNLDSAYGHLKNSLDIRPTVEGYQTLVSMLSAEGKIDAAMEYINKAIQIDPLSGINHHLKGFLYYLECNYDLAEEHFKKSLELNSNFSASTLYLGFTIICKGEYDEALDYFENLPDDESGDILKIGGLTLAHAALRKLDLVQSGILKLESFLNTELLERAIHFLILCNGILDNNKKCFEYISLGIKYRLPMLVYLKTEPLLRHLHSNTYFKNLTSQIINSETSFFEIQKPDKKKLMDNDLVLTQKEKIIDLMQTDKIYLDSELSLRGLAKLLDSSPNQLSQILNEGFGQNFSSFVNDFRLEDFKQKAMNSDNTNKTILALAFESGFNSKTVFNTYFKKSMGITPRQFWKKHHH